MAEEKEISVEKELKDRVNQIAAKLSNEHNVITLRGEKDGFVPFHLANLWIFINFGTADRKYKP